MYANNPELLSAMIIPQIEQVIAKEYMEKDQLSEINARQKAKIS